MNSKEIKTAFKASLPVMAGYLVLGMGFGIILNTKGYGVIWAMCMSICVYAGSLQYVMVNLITSGASLITTVLTALMVNARHLFYGISMIDKYKDAGKKKFYMIFALTDETYSLVCNNETAKDVEDKNKCYFFISLFDQIYWITGSIIGSMVGSMITFSTEGIDFVLTALFVTIFVDQWLSTKNHGPALVGIFASVACLLVFGSESFLIPAMICIATALTLMRGKEEAKNV